MPIYDYNCTECGGFRLMRRMADCAEPAVCPECGRTAAKSVTAPFLADMPTFSRVACQRNELSAHAPAVMSQRRLDELNGHACAASHHHQREPDEWHRDGGWIRSNHPSMIGH
jgi:putative FmdB family regulatory protein